VAVDKGRVIAIKSFVGVTVIDGGRTLAIEFADATGEPLSLLVPDSVGIELAMELPVSASEGKAERDRSST
jgi:hypothetical protein